MVLKNMLKMENLFLLICLIFGLIFLFVNPLFQAPDEPTHLFKMWGYTNKSLYYIKKDGQSGHVVPDSFIQLFNFYYKYRFDKSNKVSVFETIYVSHLKLEKNHASFVNIVPSSYTPISYFPSFLILWLLKILNVNPLWIIYIMRFCSLMVYLALCYFAIKTTPVKKEFFCIFSLLPICVYQSASISTDGLCFGLIMLFFAYTFRLAFEKEKVGLKQILKFGVLITLITICKFAYLPLIFLYFLIPSKKMPFNYLKTFLIILFINILEIVCFVLFNLSVVQKASNAFSEITMSPWLLLADMIRHPFVYLQGVLYTTKQFFMLYVVSVVICFGWDSTLLPGYSLVAWLVLICTAVFSSDSKSNFFLSNKNKAIAAVCGVLTYFVVTTAVYLVYQRFPLIIGVQGRYLVPVAFLFLMIFFNKTFVLKNKIVLFLIFLLWMMVLGVSVLTLIERFY